MRRVGGGGGIEMAEKKRNEWGSAKASKLANRLNDMIARNGDARCVYKGSDGVSHELKWADWDKETGRIFIYGRD